MKECEFMKVEKVVSPEKASNSNPAKTKMKRKLSFRLSCKSEEEMIHAIRTLKSKEGFDLDISALVTDNLPTKEPENSK